MNSIEGFMKASMIGSMKRYLVLSLFWWFSLNFNAQGLFDLSPSWTLPVIEIETENRDSITSKDSYIQATCTIYDAKGIIDGTYSIGIRGRGNSTWNYFLKKPFRLKFEKKVHLIGGGKSKHYVLLPYIDNEYSFWGNLVGFELSRRIGIGWTPSMAPYEVILNGDYIGLYFLTENIRVEKSRVDIIEQKNGETDSELITGGWLLEIDNYVEDNQIHIYDRDSKIIRFTYHSPDSLSNVQEEWLTSYLNLVNDVVQKYDYTNSDWENYIDIDELTKYYIVQEILDNPEGFVGSCWLYKDKGNDSKLKFGPVWDLGGAFYWRDQPDFITNYEVLGVRYKQRWLTELLNYPNFQKKIKEMWCQFEIETDVVDYLNSYLTSIQEAANIDHKRWSQYNYAYTSESLQHFLDRYNKKISFLHSMWDYETGINGKVHMNVKVANKQLSFNSGNIISNVRVVKLDGQVYRPIKTSESTYMIDGIKGPLCLLYTINGKEFGEFIILK